MRVVASASALALLTVMIACGYREPVPPLWSRDARFGLLGGAGAPPPKASMCRQWSRTVTARDGYAARAQSFPETNVRAACFTPVVHEGRVARPGPAPPGCRYPDATSRRGLAALADELDALASTNAPSALFPCALTAAHRTAAIRQNAMTLRALAAVDRDYPYAAVVLPGHGLSEQDRIALSGPLPGRTCASFSDVELRRFGAMTPRSEVGADALRGDVAPVAIVSGGAVHSSVVEAFALMHLLVCRERIPAHRILLEPCADHTHTNLRNSGRWLSAMGGRAAYLLTDPGIQAEYFQEWSGFELILGSIDQRSLRDWGYVIGSWRQASVGIAQGFWFTPYRFWAEPREGLGSITCVDP